MNINETTEITQDPEVHSHDEESHEEGSHDHHDHDHAHEVIEPEVTTEPLIDAHSGHSHDGDFWERYFSLITDPAHILFEITVDFAFWIIGLIFVRWLLKSVIFPKWKRKISDEVHAEIDAEHHVVHHDHVDGDENDVAIQKTDATTPPDEKLNKTC